MSVRRRKRLLATILLTTLLGVFLMSVVGCEPRFPIRISNETDQVLTVFVREASRGDVKPGSEITVEVPDIFSELVIEAKNAQGDTVYSRKFSRRELVDMKKRVVIPPLQNK